MSEAVYLFFGSSDINTFSLFKDDRVRINKFKAATAKGLGQYNENSSKIKDILLRKESSTEVHSMLFMFGSVDCKFSIYHKICNSEAPIDIITTIEEIADMYTSFVKQLYNDLQQTPKPQCVLIGVEPNGIRANLAYKQCTVYHCIDDNEDNMQKVTNSVRKSHPDIIRKLFNCKLKECCNENNFKYIDIADDIIDPVAYKNINMSIVKPEYLDMNPLCVHLCWEKTVMLYKKRLSKIGIDIDDVLDLEYTLKSYTESKQNRHVRKKRKTHYYSEADLEAFKL